MTKKKLTYSLNYRRPKSEYNSSDELMICIRYYHKCSKTNKTKIIKKSTGVKCRLEDWNSDWHKSPDRSLKNNISIFAIHMKNSKNLFL